MYSISNGKKQVNIQFFEAVVYKTIINGLADAYSLSGLFERRLHHDQQVYVALLTRLTIGTRAKENDLLRLELLDNLADNILNHLLRDTLTRIDNGNYDRINLTYKAP
jgi:hypothetical protein